MEVLIVENDSSDLQTASKAAQAAGFSGIAARSSAVMAKQYLEKGLQGELALPDAIVLDLDLGYDSGFELLRFWHSNPELAKVPLVVWTILEDHYREICKLFKVSAYVNKAEGSSVLRQVLSGLPRLVA